MNHVRGAWKGTGFLRICVYIIGTLPRASHTNSGLLECSFGGPIQEMGSESETLSTLLLLSFHEL